jgi:hypothetical protein
MDFKANQLNKQRNHCCLYYKMFLSLGMKFKQHIVRCLLVFGHFPHHMIHRYCYWCSRSCAYPKYNLPQVNILKSLMDFKANQLNKQRNHCCLYYNLFLSLGKLFKQHIVRCLLVFRHFPHHMIHRYWYWCLRSYAYPKNNLPLVHILKRLMDFKAN